MPFQYAVAGQSYHRETATRVQSLTWADIGIGMMLRPSVAFLEAAGLTAGKRQAAAASDLFSSLLSTWMPDVGRRLEVLVLVDCKLYCPKRPTCKSHSSNATPRPSACGSTLPRQTEFDGHADFNFSLPTWLQGHNASIPRLRWRCYWGTNDLFAGSKALPTNIQKGAALQRAMLETLSRKRFYVKLDVDTLLQPARLFNLLSFLDRALPAGARMYFGTTRLGRAARTWGYEVDPDRPLPGQRRNCTDNPPAGWSKSCAEKKHLCPSQPAMARYCALTCKVCTRDDHASASGNQSVASAMGKVPAKLRVFLRETEAWRSLESTFMTPEQQRAVQAVKANFAQGALFGVTHEVLHSMVRSRCMQRVSMLKCVPRCRRNRLIAIEDSNIGLCMHLLRVPLFDTSCIYTGTTYTGVLVDWRDTPESCRTPIAIHPVKDARTYRKFYGLMSAPVNMSEPCPFNATYQPVSHATRRARRAKPVGA